MAQRYYLAIDLKSFYASVECMDRGLDPLTTNLVVADSARTDKTICLAVSPSLKAFGIPGRPRLFEVVQKVALINAGRRSEKSWDAKALTDDPTLGVDYLVAPPRMARYMEVSAKVYEVYLKYVAPEDIHVYSIDEVFMDVTPYLRYLGTTPMEFGRRIIQDVLETTGITATAGVGTNLYLCKIAMDIVAKKMEADAYGVRMAFLDEEAYRRLLWDHQPITDFWRVGRGYAKRLEKIGIRTMGQIARCSLGGPNEYYNEELLYKLFGINAELLIDHAWGWEPCTLDQIKAYRPSTNCLTSGQVLQEPYTWEKAGLVLREMADLLSLDLVEKGLVTDQLVLTVGYDVENLKDPKIRYTGQVVTDPYGRAIPKHGHGTVNLPIQTASTRLITQGYMELFRRIADPHLLVRRLTLTVNRVVPESRVQREESPLQLTLFSEPEEQERQMQARWAALDREKRRQQAVLHIKRKFGKNAILRGMNLEEGATAAERNRQIGGHKA